MPHTYSSPLHILRLTLSVCFSYAPTLSQVTMKTSLGLNLRETLKFSRMSKAAWAKTSWSLGLALKKKPTSWCHLKSTSKINQQVKQATFHKANYVSRVPGAWCPWPMAPSWWPDYRHTTQEHLQEKEDNSKGPPVIYGIFIYRTVCH